MTTSSDDADLVERAKRGCAESVAALAARHQVAVVDYASRLLARRGGNRADAEDVAQESLVRALHRLDRHDSCWPFATWLFAITRRRCLNHLRAARRRAVRETCHVGPCGSAAGDDPHATAVAREESARLWATAARELTEPQFSALWLRTVEDQPVAAIARVLGRPPATVKVLLFRGRRRLAAALGVAEADAAVTLPLRTPAIAPVRRSSHG
ncbi:MAG: RNA polymerase sigma factor [Pirellulales bacterium]